MVYLGKGSWFRYGAMPKVEYADEQNQGINEQIDCIQTRGEADLF